MREVLSLLIMPVPVFLLMILMSVFLSYKKSKWGKRMFLVSSLWFLVIICRPVPITLIKNLEKEFSQLPDSAISLSVPVNILVLGAGHSDDQSLSPNNQLSLAVLGRLAEGVRIFKLASGDRLPAAREEKPATGKAAGNRLLASGEVKTHDKFQAQGNGSLKVKLIVSGAKGRLKTSQAEVLKNTAVMMGVDSTGIGMLTQTVNTRSEADEYVSNFGNDKPLVLVTDAIHMRRAVEIFTDAGVTIIPAPANFRIKNSSANGPWRWVPSARNIELMEAAVHEYAGMVWHKAGGK